VPVMPSSDAVPSQSRPMAAATFLKATPAGKFYAGHETMPAPEENP
jgi:hypothetical protein